MIVKQINRPKNSVGSFPRLFKYLTTELDPNAGTRRKRCTKREVVWSENNLSFLDTAAYEMQGVAFLNVRCRDALYYYMLSWPEGEVPSRTQWHDLHSLLADHQLRLERRKNCTYTIFNPQYNVRVKASDVFLHNFGGKHARHLTESQLGPWTEM